MLKDLENDIISNDDYISEETLSKYYKLIIDKKIIIKELANR